MLVVNLGLDNVKFVTGVPEKVCTRYVGHGGQVTR